MNRRNGVNSTNSIGLDGRNNVNDNQTDDDNNLNDATGDSNDHNNDELNLINQSTNNSSSSVSIQTYQHANNGNLNCGQSRESVVTYNNPNIVTIARNSTNNSSTIEIMPIDAAISLINNRSTINQSLNDITNSNGLTTDQPRRGRGRPRKITKT